MPAAETPAAPAFEAAPTFAEPPVAEPAAEAAPDPAVEHTVCTLLEQQWQDFHPLVRYWSLIDEDMDDGFHITPIMRKLWTRHAKPQPR